MLLSHLRVAGHSMQPTINPNDHIFVSSLPYLLMSPKKTDMIIVAHPQTNMLLVKRIVKQKGHLYFIMGDNPHDSDDSSSFGWVDKTSIKAKVVYIHHVK